VAILRGFRHLPRNLRDWAEWFARQKIEADLGNPDEDGWHLASDADGTRYWEAPPTTETATEDGDDPGIVRWTIKEFDADYSPSFGDEKNVLLVSTSGSARNVYIEEDAFRDGSQLTVYQYGAGQVTIVAGTNVSVKTPNNLTINEQYGSVTLIQVYANDWFIAGRTTP
jgi:hypothetical protein